MKPAFNKISPLIEAQFPSFYQEEGPLFVAFVKSYYEWLESTNNPLYYSRQLLSIRDVDETLDSFLPHFEKKYLNGATFTGSQRRREIVKHSIDFYRAKGTIQSLKLLFSILYNENINVYYPGGDILRTSDGKWFTPFYLEVSVAKTTITFLNRDVTGVLSGAKAFVESISQRNNDGKVIDVLYLSNIRGNFQTGELITVDGTTLNCPTVIGSLTEIEITTSGSAFELGQILDVVSPQRGKGGKVRVVSTGKKTDEVAYKLEDGGYGYTLNANVFGDSTKIYISSNVFSYATFTNSNTNITGFGQFTTITQPLINVAFNAANVTFANGSLVYGVNSTSGKITSGFILSSNQVGANGWLLISPHNLANVGINTVTFANVVSGSFIPGETVYQTNATGNSAVGLIVYANSSTAVIDQLFGPYATNTPLIGKTSNCNANVASVLTLANTVPFTNANVVTLFANTTANGANVVSRTNITATANVIASNNVAVGVISISNTFVSNEKNIAFDTITNSSFSISGISTGNPGSYKIGSIANSETVYIGTDIISSNNSGNVSFLGIRLNANNSNAASNTGYGFLQSPSANISTVIDVALAKTPLTIGTIRALSSIDVGSNNTASPFSLEIEKSIAAFGRRENFSLLLANTSGFFSNNETVIQTIADPAIAVNIGTINGTFNPTIREIVRQVRSDGNTVYGELYQSTVVGLTGTLRIRVANTSNTFDTSNTIVGTYSLANAVPSSKTTNNAVITAKGIVRNSNSTYMDVKRTSFNKFIPNLLITGDQSGVTSNVVYITEDQSANVLGNNAIVLSPAGVSNGTLLSVEVYDSGYFYEDGEAVVLSIDTNPIKGAGIVKSYNQGRGVGYWRNNDGRLDENKFIQDNYYYQEYSYEIQSGIDESQYQTIIDSSSHVAGTKRFASFNKTSEVPEGRNNIAPATYKLIVTANLSNTSTGVFTVGEQVNQGNTTYGFVYSYTSNGTINTLALVDTNGSFNTTTALIGASSNAYGNINNLNITIL
jgi:hypothetical protein